MLLLALTLAQAVPSVVTAADMPAEELVVVGQRLRRLRMRTHKDRRTGVTRCVFKRRSGDAQLDAEVCAVVLACALRVETVAAMEACVKPDMDRLARGVPWRATR